MPAPSVRPFSLIKLFSALSGQSAFTLLEMNSPTMNRLANLPVFLRLAGVKAVLAGGGEPAAWKAELLAAAGAQLHLFAPEPSERLRDVAERLGLSITERAWREADLEGALIALLEAPDETEAARFRAAARAAGALVNVIDRPKFCDFSFGSIVERSPLVIAVSTDGAAPVFAQAVRARIEAMFPRLPARLGGGGAGLAAAARRLRPGPPPRDLARFRRPRLRLPRSGAGRGGFCGAVAGETAGAAHRRRDRRRPRGGYDAARRAGAASRRSRHHRRPRSRVACAISAAARRVSRPARRAPVPPCARRRPSGSTAGETVVALVPGDGRGTAWEGAEIAPGVSP